jgi:hypothetical protein
MGTYLTNYCYALLGYESFVVTPLINPDSVAQTFNATATAKNWGGFSLPIYIIGDIVSGLTMLVNAVKDFLGGFYYLLIAFGAPVPIAIVLTAVEQFVMWFGVIEFISGRIVSQ